MSNEFPKMLFRPGGSEPMHGGHFATLIVDDEAGEAAALVDGWFVTTDEATAAAEADRAAKAQALADAEAKAIADAQAAADAVAKPTRAELEQKATELGLTFDGRTSDRKLGELIAAAVEKA